MFKKRLLETFAFIIGIPLLFATWIGFCMLVEKYTHITSWMLGTGSKYAPYFMLGFIIVILLAAVFKFVKWLFIEPFRNNKNI